MKKLKKMNRFLNFLYITPKQILSILVMIIILISSSNSSDYPNSKKLIKFKINGDIIISDVNNDNIISAKLNSKLIKTKINEKNINFKDNNILPTENGELNYIDPYQQIALLDISLEEFVINSPMIIKKYPNLVFISNRNMNLFRLNINNGYIEYMTNYNKNLLNKNYFKYIKEICPKNKDDVLFLRIDYYLKMKYSNLYFNNNNKKEKHKNNDLVWHSHYIKIVPIFPSIDILNNNNSKIVSNILDLNNNENSENDDYYIFEVIENNNINLIYSQEKYICSQVKDIENELNYDFYYFGNNKRKHLFEYNIIKNKEEKPGFSIYLKKIFLIIIIFALIIFGLNLYKRKPLEIKINKNDFMNDIKNKIAPLQNNIINNEDHVDVKMENQNGNALSPKSKSISNLSTNCSIDLENKQNNKIDPKSSSKLNFKFINRQKNTSSGKKRDHSKNQSRNSALHTKRRWSKLKISMKNLIKDLKKLTKKEGEELKDLFATYISDINKNTSDYSNLNLNSNSNLTDNEDIYKKIFSLIKSEDSSSSEDIDINEQSQGSFTGELENNFLFSFDNGRLLKLYKDFQFIGKGGFGVVFKATQKIDESQCAIKMMKINLNIKEDKEKEDLKVTQEIKSMLKFKKKNIVRYKTCWFEFKQKKAKKKRERAMSLEQSYTPGIDFNNDFIKKGKKRIKNRLKNYLKTSLERIQSISKEIKLAEKQNNAQKNRKRKSSIIWDDDDESDSDSLGANRNYAIKEEGEDTYINLDDNENSIEEVSENINDENEENSNSNSGSESENSNSENDNSNNINEFKVKDSKKEEKKSFNENKDNSEQKDEVENFQNKIKDVECNSNSNLNLKKIDDYKDFSSDNKEDNNEDEYHNLRNKKNLLKTDLNNESSSKNTNSKDNNFNIVGRDSENNSLFDEEIKKEKEELNIEKKTENFEINSNEESESDEDEDEDEDEKEDEDDLKNNSDNEGLRTPKKKKKKKKNKTYPIYFFIQMEYCSGCPMNYYLSHRSEVPSRRLTTYMLYQMCNAVKHIHEGNIIHRDLKPGNIFIIDDYLIKIGDFGLALNSTVKEYKQGGTYLYQSPEQIKNEPYDEKIDIFALGVILVELVSKFNTEFERRETLQGLKKEIYPEYLKKDHLKEYNLVKKMTRLNPKERPNIKDIFNDNDFNDLITESSA